MLKVDFHIHTKYSIDASIKPKDLLKKSKQLKIIPTITDHNTIKAFHEFKNCKFIPGEEIKTDIGDLIGLFLQDKIPKKTSFLEALDLIKQQDGISILPHGFDQTRGNIAKLYSHYAKKVQIIEVFNGRCLSKKNNSEALDFAKKNKKLMCAGSDSHFLFEFGKTYVQLPEFDIKSPKSLLKSLKKGKIIGEYSPKYVRGTTTVYKYLKKLFP